METSGDNFATAPTPSTSPRPDQAPLRPSLARGRWSLVAVLCVAVAGAVTVVVHVRAGAGPRPVRDMRPVVLPATMLGQPLRSDPAEQTYQQQLQPTLGKIFGSHAAAIGQYSTTTAINLIAGRGPVAGRPAGDVHAAAAQHQTFGDITCANMVSHQTVLPLVDVCWYSTPTFGASLLIADGNAESMAQIAAALDAAVPGMRDG